MSGDFNPGLFGGAMRSVPNNTSCECALLGSVLMQSKKTMEAVEEILRPEHFYDRLNGVIYEKALMIYNEGRTVDPFTIIRHFEHPDLDLWGEVDPKVYISKLAAAYVSDRLAYDYAREIRETAMRRDLMALCQQTSDACCKPEDQKAEEILEGHEAALMNLASGNTETQPNVTFHEALCTAVTKAKEAVARGSALAGLSWGYKSLDRLTNGLVGGNMYVLGARPAMGKTSLGLGIGLRIASNGARVLFWSGEMTADQLGARGGAAKSGLNLRSVFSGRRWDVPEEAMTGEQPPLEDWQWAALNRACDAAYHLALETDTRGGLSVAMLRSRARRMKRSKKGLDAIVLDYVQLMRGSPRVRGRLRYEEMTEISNELKVLAKELDVPVVVLAQLNRESEKRENKRPQMQDLRDTGALEQDADVIGLIHREHYYLKKEASSGELTRRDRESPEQFSLRCQEFNDRLDKARGRGDVHIVKNRHGPEGRCRMLFDDETTWFRDESEDPRSPAWGRELADA
ncbi:DnaB-like helicase C-terminal domain-containing protein [Gluconobacter cerinus]|uniref:DnaB-like helicase C-terminal domain-containing protein n=1 Tax=Gluconobacter cerinus TaxID=38307 RepID=UPI001B8CE494|nr:DnaB-like helicase C-terminal domain-containing protein [Gluconobacter cerinus]MBS1067269.1 AAA family ATPase [Gluconobacter cerinus]